MNDMKVANTEDIRLLNKTAIKCKFNRALSDDAIAALDPEGNHVLVMMLYGHNMDSARELHHRTRAILKVPGTMEPITAMLDVLDTDWKELHDVPGQAPVV